jgi:hypothetical protein
MHFLEPAIGPVVTPISVFAGRAALRAPLSQTTPRGLEGGSSDCSARSSGHRNLKSKHSLPVQNRAINS